MTFLSFCEKIADNISARKKVCDFFHASKRHIFCENKFSRKISLRSSKSLINQAFLMAINPISSGAFAPSSSPAALLSFFCSIVFRQPGSAPVGRCPFLVPVVELDLRCGAGHLWLKRAAGTFLSALGFESFHAKIQRPHGTLYFWCRWWDSNPHGVAPGGF